MKKGYAVLILFVVIALGYVLKPSGVAGNAIAATGVMSIPTSQISSTAQFYEYAVNGVAVRFFAVKDSDGSIKTAFDACDVCGAQKKGYRQEGDQMVCNNCGNKYPLSGLGTENTMGGGCWPGFLPSKVQGDSLVINKADLAAGKRRFA
ncbi:DUF2318 domain-containing protein [Candidatus Woesearchaeota archaeon]|nr:DUF2318 domain-containing protein [Candidatus Woesearchaeota archaeon]